MEFQAEDMTAEEAIQRLIDAAVRATDALAFGDMRNKDEIVRQLLDAIADGHMFKDKNRGD